MRQIRWLVAGALLATSLVARPAPANAAPVPATSAAVASGDPAPPPLRQPLRPPPPRPLPPAPPSAADPADPVVDPRLDADVATARRVEGTAGAQVAVEVITAYDSSLARRIVELGGKVTGSVPGAVVQGTVPATRVDDLALTRGVQQVRSPKTVNQRPPAIEAGFGGTVGDEVTATNAATWHDTAPGLTGAGVKVGIIDYFVMSLWNESEHGPTPTVGNGHMFCLDNSGSSLCNGDGSVNSANGDRHGVAVTEIVKDMAPGSDIYIATVGTLSDLTAAIDWFAGKGVHIVTRSLGSAYDGPGDGTGPLAAVIDDAASKGITWFNSAGNDAYRGYLRVTVPAGLAAGGYVDFNDDDNVPDNAAVDTVLRIDSAESGGCRGVYLDGIRWSSDWYLPAAQRDDYVVEVYQATDTIGSDHNNPTLTPLDINPFAGGVQNTVDANQRAGADPLELANWGWCNSSGVTYLRIKKKVATVGTAPDVIEIAMGSGDLEAGMYDIGGSAAKPAVDSRNPALVAVGALASPGSSSIAYYSSQGPTSDGRVKPDVAAPSCISSTIYAPSCFAGTSAASPAAAGMAAVLYGRGLAAPGEGLAALVKHLTTDLGTAGPDNAFGAGKLAMGSPPAAATAGAAAQFVPVTPTRILDTRPAPDGAGPTGLRGVKAPQSIVDLPVLSAGPIPASGVSAVVVNVTSVAAPNATYVQAYPTLQGPTGGTSTLNISTPGLPRPNFAIVQVGEGGSISLYLHAGGHVIVDVLGYFTPAPGSSVTNGRFVPVDPERWMDTNQAGQQPAGPFDGPRRADAGETVTPVRPGSSAVPVTGVDALVVNVTADMAGGGGFLRAEPAGASGLTHSTVNYESGAASANTAIVELGAGSAISVFTSQSARVIVDVVGYITTSDAPSAPTGLYVAVTPGRNYDSRLPTPDPLPASTNRDVTVVNQAGPAAVVPGDASGVSGNLTVVGPAAGGFLVAFPKDGTVPGTSNVNYATGQTVANGALLKLGTGGAVTTRTSQTTHFIIDISGYFTG